MYNICDVRRKIGSQADITLVAAYQMVDITENSAPEDVATFNCIKQELIHRDLLIQDEESGNFILKDIEDQQKNHVELMLAICKLPAEARSGFFERLRELTDVESVKNIQAFVAIWEMSNNPEKKAAFIEVVGREIYKSLVNEDKIA